jgi:hypothetical protein
MIRRSSDLLVAVLVVATSAWTLTGGFLGDDFAYIARFAQFPWSEWPSLFVSEWSGGMWGAGQTELRPIAALSLLIDHAIWGGNAFGYRLTNLALHLGSTLMVMRVAEIYCPRTFFGPLAAGVWFALQPAHVEPVTWIIGRVDLLATFFALGFWLTAERYVQTRALRWLALALGTLTLGVFAKEVALVSPALLILSWILLPAAKTAKDTWRPRARVLLVVAVVITTYAVCRSIAFDGNVTAAYSGWNDTVGWKRQASYLGWLVPVLPFFLRHEFRVTPAPELGQGLWFVAAALIIGAFVWCRLRRNRPLCAAVFFGPFWYFATVSGLLLVGYFSPRHLYFSSVGVAVAAGIIAGAYMPPGRAARVAATILISWFGTARLVAQIPWSQAGRISNEIAAAVQERASNWEAGEALIVDAPSGWRTAWLWAWASPFFAGPPFVSPGLPFDQVLERPESYYRPGAWLETKHPIAVLSVARGATLIHVSRKGDVVVRRLGPEALQGRLTELAPGAAGGITAEEWTQLLERLAEP